MTLHKPEPIDPLVLRYWEKERSVLEREKNDTYRPGCSERELGDMVRNRRGLLGSSEREYAHGLRYIAAGLVDEGLKHARFAVRFGELAQDVEDLGIYNDSLPPDDLRRQSRETGLARLHASLYWGKWMLGEPTAQAHLELSLQSTKIYWEEVPPQTPVTDPGDQSIGLWGTVVPFLRIGWVEDAARWFRLVVGPKPMSVRETARTASYLDRRPAIQLSSNAMMLRAYLQTLLAWLSERRESEERARSASDTFHFTISRWGHNERSVQGRLWNQFLRREHVELAQLRAQYFTHEIDPIAIVQSIRGMPLVVPSNL
ncbi:MAG TPA: hypothetical protein VF522_10960 [Ramlibacter sp.]|uniref:hypothetical protein n=1 Tax=Ramlibacter sp. TaxID=1917967 RepID=UPI002ED50981